MLRITQPVTVVCGTQVPTIRRGVRPLRSIVIGASLLALAVSGACSDGHGGRDGGSAAPTVAGETAQSAQPFEMTRGADAIRVSDPSEDAVVIAVGTAFDNAWNAADAARLAALYAERAEFVNILGSITTSRAAIQAQHAFLFSGPFKGSRSASVVRRLVYLTGTTAILDLDVELTGYVSLSPGIRPTRPGVLATRFKHLLAKHGGRWFIETTQSTAIQPPMAPLP
ncbi:MAG: SgcJ/EcaC family oxidoreductase [bacterium]